MIIKFSNYFFKDYCNSVTIFSRKYGLWLHGENLHVLFFFLLAVTEQKTNSLAVKNPKKNGNKNNNNKRH